MQAIKQMASNLLANFIEFLESKIGTDYSYSHRAGAKLHALGVALERSGEITIKKDGAFFVVHGGNIETRNVYLHNAISEYAQKVGKL